MAKAKGQLEQLLTEMGQKMDQLIAEMKTHTDGVSEEMEKQIKDLKEKMKSIDKEKDTIGAKAKERWGNAKPHFDEAFKEVGQAFKRFTGK
jgi:predicted nuclease with TOPRIM domain